MKLIADKRGSRSARMLEDAIAAWYATKDAWLPDLERRLAPFSAEAVIGAPSPGARPTSAGTSPSRPGSFLSRMRASPA